MNQEVERFFAQWVADGGRLVHTLTDVVPPDVGSVIVAGIYLAAVGWLFRVLSCPRNYSGARRLGVASLVMSIVRLALTIVLVMAGMLLGVARAAGRSHYRW